MGCPANPAPVRGGAPCASGRVSSAASGAPPRLSRKATFMKRFVFPVVLVSALLVCLAVVSRPRAMAEDEVIDSILLAQEAERSTPAPADDEIRDEFERLLKEWREQGASWQMLEQRRTWFGCHPLRIPLSSRGCRSL